jgi:hypothetical protein
MHMQLTQTANTPPILATTSESSHSATWLVTVKVLAEMLADASETEAAIRANIFKAETRINSRGERIPGNGLAEHGAIVRRGRKVLLNPPRYMNWLSGRPPVAR